MLYGRVWIMAATSFLIFNPQSVRQAKVGDGLFQLRWAPLVAARRGVTLTMTTTETTMEVLTLLFTFNGRINRARFWIGTIPLVVAGIAAIALFDWMFMRAQSLVPVYGFGITASAALLWGQLSICIKRLHDRGKSGWWLLALWALPAALSQIGQTFSEFNLRIAVAIVVSLIWLWSPVELGFLRGTDGPNAYGPDPLPAPTSVLP